VVTYKYSLGTSVSEDKQPLSTIQRYQSNDIGGCLKMAWLIGYVLSERFRRSGRSKKKRDYILDFPGVNDKETASLLVGREIEYRDNFVRVEGKIIRTHGARGKVRARFTKPLPGEFWRGRVYLRVDRLVLGVARYVEGSY
jgi:large subunit ribosomal protein L35Ae